MSAAFSSATAAMIYRGTVLSVDPETYRAEVAYDNRESALPDAQIASLYCHPYDGEGIDVLPAPDSSVYVFQPSDGGLPFIMGYVMPLSKSSKGEGGGRRPRKPGEYIFRGRGGNFIGLRSGGVLEIGATPLAQTLYLPLGNIIREIFGQKECLSVLGQMKWTHADVGLDLRTKSTFVFEHKDAVEDLFPRLTVEMSSDKADFMPEGYVSSKPSTDFSQVSPPLQSFFRVKVDGGAGLSGLNVLSNMAFQVSLDGDLYVHSEGFLLLDSMGPMRLESKGSLELIGPLSHDVTSAIGVRSIKATSLNIDARGLTFSSMLNDFEGLNRLGGLSAVNSIPRGEVLLAWMTAVGLVTGVTPPADLLSTTNKVS